MRPLHTLPCATSVTSRISRPPTDGSEFWLKICSVSTRLDRPYRPNSSVLWLVFRNAEDHMSRVPTPHEHSYNYFQSDPLKWKVCFANRRQKRRHNQKPTCERLAILVSPSPSPLQFQTSSLSLPPGARRHVSSSPRPCVPNNCATCTGQCVEILQFLI